MTFISINGIELPEVDTNILISDTQKASAVQRAGQRISISPTGAVIKTVSGVTSYGVGEGKAKTASGSASKIAIGNNKFAAVTVETLEAWVADGRIADAVFGYGPTAHAKAFDSMVLGLTPVPVEFANFATLSAAEEVEIATGADASVTMDDALSEVTDGAATAVVLTTAMLAYLKRQRLSASGTRVFDITGNTNEGVIDGLPYYTVTSAQRFGYVGNFAERYFWGATDVLTPTFFVKDAGSISDNEGVTHNLTSENKLALFHELFQGSGVAGLDYFKKIVPVTA